MERIGEVMAKMPPQKEPQKCGTCGKIYRPRDPGASPEEAAAYGAWEVALESERCACDFRTPEQRAAAARRAEIASWKKRNPVYITEVQGSAAANALVNRFEAQGYKTTKHNLRTSDGMHFLVFRLND